MREAPSLPPPPPLEDLEKAALTVRQNFNPRKIVYLNRRGEWKENPQTLRDRITHALLFHLWSQGEKESSTLLRAALAPLLKGPSWALGQKLWVALGQEERPAGKPESGEDLQPLLPLLIPLEALLWVIEQEAYRVNSEAYAPDWNAEAQARKADHQKKLQAFNQLPGSVLNGAENQLWQQETARLKDTASSLVDTVAKLIAEEENITAAIEPLLERAAGLAQKEDVYAVVLDKIHPPMGIVTQTSPALFFPCLRLLLNRRIDISSGIPYLASVILSFFHDPRSAEPLLEALEMYPVGCTKIRENIIYTLGTLREERAVEALIRVLGEPDSTLLLEQKEEAIWALGKIGFGAVRAVPSLAPYADHSSARLKTYLAWTLGEVGRAQKEKSGGVSSDIVIALLKLLKEKNRQVFEEAVSALRRMQMPEFIHALYLYNVGAISILGLKPAQRGLYELSETLHYLLQTKKRTIMSVNGDSGTGKTYFCQAIADGFAGLKSSEILYLMRDTKRGQKVFNRLLGLTWLRKHIDPAYYQDYPLSEDEDDPEAYFREFLEENAAKRLIILDGCRDRHYFQKVIDFFYQKGELDIEVNFRADFSTRRLNLEEREFTLESVKLHLAFLEDPALEDTSFYQEGVVILYDLDNSHASRLNRQETRELFEKRRIDSWGELIRIGDFAGERKPLSCRKETVRPREDDFSCREEDWPEVRVVSFSPEESKFKPILNEDLAAEPNLLLTIPLDDLRPDRLRFYAQDQIAGTGERGTAFVLTFLDNRIFQTRPGQISDLALLGRTLFLAAPARGLLSLSFERNEMAEFISRGGPPLKVAAFPPDRVITAHGDGMIRVWDFLERKVFAFASGLPSLSSLAADHSGRIHAGAGPGWLRQWDLDSKKSRTLEGLGRAAFIRPYPYGKILAIDNDRATSPVPLLRIVDFDKQLIRTIPAPQEKNIAGVNVYFDGRVVIGFSDLQEKGERQSKSLAVISLLEDACLARVLSGHGRGTKDCLAMGPRIVTCGEEIEGRTSLCVWGNELYVKTELGKLFIKPQ